MDIDTHHATAASNVDDWLACFSPLAGSKLGIFPFTSHKIQSIESRRGHMSDLLIFDLLLIRGGIRNPDMLFPPADWTALKKVLDAVDQSVYDILKKDCLVYILLKWTWDIDPRETNAGWDVRYIQDRCIPPQFAALADAYWMLDTGTHLDKAVSILSDARLNSDYASKILQALALSSSPASFASGTAPATAALVVKYVRTAKPLLTEPDDIDLYALSLAQLSFMDAWAYQKSFPEASDTRERLLRKIIGCPESLCSKHSTNMRNQQHQSKNPSLNSLHSHCPLTSKHCLHALALPSQLSTSALSGVNTHTTATSSGPILSPHAVSILQDLLCVRAIQSGDYVGAIKLDREFASVSPSLGSGASPSSIASQTTSSGRDTIDRKSIIQDLFSTLPPAERTLLEDEFGKVATGVRGNAISTPRHGAPAVKKLLMAEMSLSASWEDVGSAMGSPAPSTSLSSSAVGTGLAGKATPTPKVAQPHFTSRAPRPQAPPTPKFTAFGSPIPSTSGVSTGRGLITERGKTLFSTNAAGGPIAIMKPAIHVSLFDTAGSAKNATNAFYKPPSARTATTSLDVGSALAGSSTAKNAGQGTSMTKQNGKAQGGEDAQEDVSMGSGSDVEIIEEDHHDEAGIGEQDEEAATEEDEDDAGNFITHDKSGAADLTFHRRDVDEAMGEDDGQDLGYSVFSESKSSARNDSAGGYRYGKRSVSGNGHAPYASPPRRARVSPPRGEDRSPNTSVKSTTTTRWRAPPGAFHNEEEDDEDQHDKNKNEEEDEDEEDDRVSLTTPMNSPRRSTRTRMQTGTPPRASTRSQPQRKSKNTTTTTGGTGRPLTHARGTSSSRPRPSQTIPGALMDEDNDEHDMEHTDAHGNEDTEMDDQEEEDDAIAPLPSRSSRRTRSSGFVGTSSKSKPGFKSAAPGRGTTATDTDTTAKGKARARPSEVKTPARRSSRLSTASSQSPEYIEVASPTKKGRKSTGSRASIAGSASGAVATRSSARRKR
ncbi:nuclear pore complex assembly-domain-containing protein [Boletus reticuloceps]|uniref:Nuclear pore complex assembly-domain-containing protein n=1 Tax=Boletus reticuloceps TaxID=495285 RepID=A0A8I2YSX9_9AGAM|nr:nuclear pore complex assembly-domain-containing protein [Boletus reticuloceps]